MSIFTNFSAIIFDMDGLVLDSESTYLRAWQKAGQEMGYEFGEAFCLSMSGLHSAAVSESLLEYCGSDFDLALFGQLSGAFWSTDVQLNGIEKKKGLEELLFVIKQHHIPFCLATNSLEKNARECLALAGLKDEFPLIVARDHVEKGKPAPDIFLKAAGLLQQSTSQCMVLEDSATGIEAAKNAGAIKILIPSQAPVSNELSRNSDAVFNDLAEVAQIILVNLPKNKNLAV